MIKSPELAIHVANATIALIAVFVALRVVRRMRFTFQRLAATLFLGAVLVFALGETLATAQLIFQPTWLSPLARELVQTLAVVCLAIAFLLVGQSETREIKVVRRRSETDGLTHLSNISHFRSIAKRRIAFAKTYRLPLSLVMVDLDNFKRYNDRYGHEAGNAALRCVAAALRNAARSDDLIARYGGEEFLVLTTAHRDDAPGVGERIRRAIAERCTPRRNAALCEPVTASIGIGTLTNDVATVGELIKAADKQMYRAKGAGKNCVMCADVPNAESRSNAERHALSRTM